MSFFCQCCGIPIDNGIGDFCSIDCHANYHLRKSKKTKHWKCPKCKNTVESSEDITRYDCCANGCYMTSMEEVKDKINPDHYKSHPSGIECIDVTRHMSFNIGNAIKYLWRCDLKNGIEDLKKAVWYIQDEIKQREKQNEKNNDDSSGNSSS